MQLPNVTYNPPEPPLNGMVFIHATWSGYSALGLQQFSNTIKDYKECELYIYDIDLPEYTLFEQKYNVKSHGSGELYKIENGNANLISRVTNRDITIH